MSFSNNTSQGKLGRKEQEVLGNLVREVSKMKPPANFLETIQCSCGYFKSPVKSGFRFKSHPHLQGGVYLDTACRECHEKFDSYATVVCTTCKTTVVRMEPFQDKKNGFMFSSGKVYHVSNCGQCCSDTDMVTGEQNVTQIMEVAEFLKRKKL